MRKTWRERAFGSPTCPKRKHSYRPCFEELEARLTPYSYTWTNNWPGVGDGVWENAKNWISTDGGTLYPAGASDSATFKPQFPSSCTMTQPETVAQIVSQGWTGVLTLQAQLTLMNGSSSWMTGTIVQKTGTTNGPIEVSPQAIFNWEGGDINPSGGASTFTVDRLGTFTVGALVNNKFGDDLNNSGQLNLTNTGSHSVTLVNRPRITNTSSGTIQITTSNSVGILVQSGDLETIQNQGLIVMEANITGGALQHR